MSNLTMNKVAAAVLVAGLIGMVTGKATEFLYFGGPEHPGAHQEAKRGFAIEVVSDAVAADGAAPAAAVDIKTLLATADAKAGADLFNKKCTTCHNAAKGAGNKIGPNLYGIVNSKVAAAAGFNYSAGMKGNASKTWSFDELNGFLAAPQKWVKGTMMSFAGLQKDSERANVIAYLNSNSDKPAALPKK